MHSMPRTDALMPIEDALKQLELVIDLLYQVGEDQWHTENAWRGEKALQRIREVLATCNANGTFSKR
jgi:hypothetical protein